MVMNILILIPFGGDEDCQGAGDPAHGLITTWIAKLLYQSDGGAVSGLSVYFLRDGPYPHLGPERASRPHLAPGAAYPGAGQVPDPGSP